MKRAKIVLDVDAVRRLLGLPEDLRVVGLVGLRDPDAVHVLVEGEGLPDHRRWAGAPADARLAAAGLVEAPPLWHPIQGGESSTVPAVMWGGWRLGDTRLSALKAELRGDAVALVDGALVDVVGRNVAGDAG